MNIVCLSWSNCNLLVSDYLTFYQWDVSSDLYARVSALEHEVTLFPMSNSRYHDQPSLYPKPLTTNINYCVLISLSASLTVFALFVWSFIGTRHAVPPEQTIVRMAAFHTRPNSALTDKISPGTRHITFHVTHYNFYLPSPNTQLLLSTLHFLSPPDPPAVLDFPYCPCYQEAHNSRPSQYRQCELCMVLGLCRIRRLPNTQLANPGRLSCGGCFSVAEGQ